MSPALYYLGHQKQSIFKKNFLLIIFYKFSIEFGNSLKRWKCAQSTDSPNNLLKILTCWKNLFSSKIKTKLTFIFILIYIFYLTFSQIIYLKYFFYWFFYLNKLFNLKLETYHILINCFKLNLLFTIRILIFFCVLI
jgi:hypothetical protein